MNGSGCKNCPVKPCETMNYRGSACAAQRAKFGLGDPKTNADRIRAMTDEELADMFAQFEFSIAKEVCAIFGVDITIIEHDFGASAKEELEWLKQPAKGE